MATVEKNKPLFEISVEARLMAERLARAAMGELVTYDELSDIIGQNVRLQRNKGRLNTALRTVLNDHRMVFGVVVNEGYKRLADADMSKIGRQSARKIRREAQRAKKKMACVNLDKLTSEQKSEWNVAATIISMTEEVSAPRAVKAIESAVSKTQQQLPVAKALEAAFSVNGK